MRLAILLAALALVSSLPTARAQPVEVTALAAPDAFTTAGRDTGLPGDLWRGAPLATVKTVLPLIATKPLSPATAALARRVLATGAAGPEGAQGDADLAGLRAGALLALGEVGAVAAILDRAPGLDRNAGLSRAAAESALLAGDEARACAVAAGLTVGREEIYWLRLRTYCQALAGQTAAAQLSFELAQTHSRDATFGRLMGAKLAGAGSPGAASLRHGLDLALSRSLSLDLSAAKPSPAVAAALRGGTAEPPAFAADPPGPFGAAIAALAAGGLLPDGEIDRLLARASAAEGKARAGAEAGALLAAATAPATAFTMETRAWLAALNVPAAKAPTGRALALGLAGGDRRIGEAAMLAIWIAAEAGPEGPSVGDRVSIVRGLMGVGLEAEARLFAAEGLAALK